MIGRVLISVTLILVMAASLDLDDIFPFPRIISAPALLLALLIAVVDRVFMAYKWNILLRAKEIRIPLWETTKIYLMSGFFGLGLFSTLGADAARTFVLSRKGYRTTDVGASIVLERALGFLALVLLGVVGTVIAALTIGEYISDNVRLAVSGFVISIGVLGVILWIGLRIGRRPKLPTRLSSVASSITQTGIWPHLSEGIRSFTQYRHHNPEVLGFLALTLLENLLPILWTYLLALALGVEVPLALFVLLVPLALLLSRIPISIAGIGVHEGVYVMVLSMLAISKSEALQLGLATHALMILVILPGAVVYLTRGIRGRLHHIDTVSPADGVHQ